MRVRGGFGSTISFARELGFTDDFSEFLIEDIGGVSKGMNVVAGASEIISVHRLDAYKWVKQQTDAGKNVFSKNFPVEGKKNLFAFFDKITDEFPPTKIVQYDGHHAAAYCENQGLMFICNQANADLWVYAYCTDRSVLNNFRTKYGKNEKRLKLNWWYPTDSGFDERDIDFYCDIPIYDEFYPFVPDVSPRPEGVSRIQGYFKEYLDSKAPILLLVGDPGTGKTTFIRHLINEHSLETVVTYDERVMDSDYFYCEFLTDSTKQLMVIEDADILLQARDEGTNKTMNKLLNVSDGIIQLGKKKIVFSTNIVNLNKIDEALIRPGRCFDVLNFRQLTFPEAQAACQAAGLPELDKEKDYPLSEIFNRRQHTYFSHRLGFKGFR